MAATKGKFATPLFYKLVVIFNEYSPEQRSRRTLPFSLFQDNLIQHAWRTTNTVIEITGLKQRCGYR